MSPVLPAYPIPVDLKLLERLQIAVFIKSADLRYVMLNEISARMLGSEVKNVIGTNDFAHFDEASAQLIQDRDREILVGRKIKRYSSVVQGADQAWLHYKTTKLPLLDPAGQPVGLIGVSLRKDLGDPKETLACFEFLSKLLEDSPNKITALLTGTLRAL